MKLKRIRNGILSSVFSAFFIGALLVLFARVVGSETSTSCNIQRGPCMQETGDGITIEFDVRPRPVTTLSELTFIIILTESESGLPLTDASVGLDLSMPGMFMGNNRPVMHRVSAGRYEGKGIITRCMSGRKTWQAKGTVEHAGKTVVVDFVFEVN
jgi:hypothetical protein